MVSGAVKLNMATGSETLVKTDNHAYISNYAMEDDFGGDPIMVLFEGQEDDLLSLNNMEKMWRLEERLKYNEAIFSLMSPASLVHQITDKQSREIKKQMANAGEGLSQMADKLIEIGTGLKKKQLPNPKLMEEKIEKLMVSMDGSKIMEDITADLPAQFKENITSMGLNLQGLEKRLASIKKEVAQLKQGLAGGISQEELNTMADGFITMGDKLIKLSEGLNIFGEKSEMMLAYFPHNQEELDNILYENGSLRDVFSDTIINDRHMLMMIKLKGNLDDPAIDSIYEDLAYAMAREEFDVNYIISGKPVLDRALKSEMKSNMKLMVISAVFLMLIILFLVFKVRWRALSLLIIFISVVATLGLMSHLGVPMTMVSMAVFPILIGLGINYSIQFQNRYEEENAIKITFVQIGKAVGISVLATVLGFASLYASPVPMIQDFGKMLTIGVIVSFIGSMFLLMPILGARDSLAAKTMEFKHKENHKTRGLMDKFLIATGNLVIKLAPLILVVAIVLAGLGLVADTKVGVETDIEAFMPQDMAALEDIRYIRDIVGSTNQMVLFMEDDNLLNKDNLQWMRNTVGEIKNKFADKIVDIKFIDNPVNNISSAVDINIEDYINILENDIPETQRRMFINDKMNKAVIIMSLDHMATEDLQVFVEDIKYMLEDAPIKTSITGKSVLDVEMVKGLTDGRIKMTLIGLTLVFLALLVLYRNFFKALVPVFPVILIVGMSGGIMKLLGLKYTPITATLGALVLGMGSEMTIMLLERYLEERNLGKNKEEAMEVTMKNIGKATVASGLTTVGGFSVLMTSKFVILKDFGLMTVINISLALIASFVILPALIWIFDSLIVGKKFIQPMGQD